MELKKRYDWLIETETHILSDSLIARSISSSETDKYDDGNKNKQIDLYSAEKWLQQQQKRSQANWRTPRGVAS